MNLKLSQYLKYGGIIVGSVGALRIVFAELELILQHPLALVITGIGALVYFCGVWESRHEKALAAVSPTVTTSSTTTTTVTPAV